MAPTSSPGDLKARVEALHMRRQDAVIVSKVALVTPDLRWVCIRILLCLR
ncbi:hypothetical protein HMPREF9621_01891 [Cutibacterium modestum HL037PA2]|nr:hypothetical protein HMPREF9621_01891 [Cutibacterium modestum HL037PA2]